MNYFSIVLEQVEIFVVYLLIGIIAVKTNVLNREKLGALSSCVTKILLPLLIFSNAINGATKEQFLSSTVILLLQCTIWFSIWSQPHCRNYYIWIYNTEIFTAPAACSGIADSWESRSSSRYTRNREESISPYSR